MKHIKAISIILGMCILTQAGCTGNKFSQESTYVKSNNNSISISIVDESITPEGLTILLTNNTDEDITFDNVFILEEKHNEKWYIINENQEFNALGIILDANSSSEFDIKFDEKLGKGNYRIIKSFSTSDKTIKFDVEFRID